MTRYYCTDYQVIDWLMTKYGIRFEYFVDDQHLTTANDIAYALAEEIVKAYVHPDSLPVLHGLPSKTKNALKVLGMWPEEDQPPRFGLPE